MPQPVSDSFKPAGPLTCCAGGMTVPSRGDDPPIPPAPPAGGSVDLDAARRFLAASGRVMDRRAFDRLFGGGPAQPVRDAVAAYRNPDGGFGHGMEPDCRSPGSQPVATAQALRTLDEADAWDAGLAAGACDWLAGRAAEGGGSVAIEPTVDGWPHAPWWEPPGPEEGRAASLISTGQLAGVLHARQVRHPWLADATSLMWQRIDGLTEAGPYDMLGVFRFLDHVPDRERARAAAARCGELLLAAGAVDLDPEAPGETHSPLFYAPLPASAGRVAFDDEVIGAHLDHLERGQRADGGWMFNWPAWSPAAEADWRGFVTVEALCTLRANGRL
jgi:hypothetical protein